MMLIWHLVKKDLHRLRLPVALLSLLTIGKLVFYAVASGLLRAPDPKWLNLLRFPPEYLLRNLAEPLIAYFLVGWLVFEDSPVEKDSHWITRPISGPQLFAAKLAAAGLMFVLLPLALNLPWWRACGFAPSEIAMAGLELVAVNSIVVAMGLMCASLTDGFPRYVLWSLVGLAGFALVQIILAPFGGASFGIGVSRLLVCSVVGAVIGLVLAVHQFATRRHRKSLALAIAGVLLVGALGRAWPWNLTTAGGPQLALEGKSTQGMRLNIIEPAHSLQIRNSYFAQLDLRIADMPGDALVSEITAVGEWSFGGARVWSSRTNLTSPALTDEAIRRVAGSKTSQPAGGQAILSLPFSPQIVRRAEHEPMAVHASIDLDVFHGKIVAELPVREGTASGTRSYTISHLFNGPLNENQRRKANATGMGSAQNVVVLVLTDRSADGLIANAIARPFITSCALVNRGTGEFFRSDPARSGPIAITTLNQTKVACTQLSFPVGAAPIRLEEMTLVVIRFGDGESVKRTLEIAPISFVEGPVSRTLPP